MTQAPTLQAKTGPPRWLSWASGFLGLAALGWVLRGFDYDRFRIILSGADLWLAALVPLSVLVEQLVRARKWQQLLYPLRPVGVLRLFGAIMAGYLLAFLIPLGFGTVARSWLVARREDLKVASVLATVALDRLTDGIVFTCLVPLALFLVVFDDPTGEIRAGLAWGGISSFVLFTAVVLALMAYRRGVFRDGGRMAALPARLPQRIAPAVQRLSMAFGEGISWPRETWRGISIVVASVVIKLIAITPMLWAGLSIGVQMSLAQYLFVMVFLGFVSILGHSLRFIGSFVIGGVYALGLFGVGAEQALVMVLMVEASSLLTVAAVGAASLWRQGVALADARAAAASDVAAPARAAPRGRSPCRLPAGCDS